MTNFQNPIGATLPLGKKALVDFYSRDAVPLIEDDVYGELHITQSDYPLPTLAFDRRGLVMQRAVR